MRDIAFLIFGVVLGAALVLGSAWTPREMVRTTHQPVLIQAGKPLAFKDEMAFHAGPTVRKMFGTNGACSAVVVAPGLALTAQHCKAVGEMTDATVEGHHVAKVRVYSKKDVMLLSVPGLVCPCADLGDAPVVIGEDVASIGYPGGTGRVVAIGMGQEKTLINNVVYTTHTAYSGPGMSGGGLFVRREGKPLLAALTRGGVEGVFTLATDVSWMRVEHLKMLDGKE